MENSIHLNSRNRIHVNITDLEKQLKCIILRILIIFSFLCCSPSLRTIRNLPLWCSVSSEPAVSPWPGSLRTPGGCRVSSSYMWRRGSQVAWLRREPERPSKHIQIRTVIKSKKQREGATKLTVNCPDSSCVNSNWTIESKQQGIWNYYVNCHIGRDGNYLAAWVNGSSKKICKTKVKTNLFDYRFLWLLLSKWK